MFNPVRNNIFRWGTPDPEGDWMMFGHLLMNEDACIAIDPPLVPGLIESINRMGKLEAIILTTLDHTRGSRYLSHKTGATLYVPDQSKSFWLDPDQTLEQKGIKDYERYKAGKMLGMDIHGLTVEGGSSGSAPWLDEYAFLTPEKDMIVGDIAIGNNSGGLSVAPEWFPHDPPHEPYIPAREEFSRLVLKTGAKSLLASHGDEIYENLPDFVKQDPTSS